VAFKIQRYVLTERLGRVSSLYKERRVGEEEGMIPKLSTTPSIVSTSTVLLLR
jgi:hypothetical protein